MRYPKVYNPGGDFLAVLDNISGNTAQLYRKVNSDFTFAFEAVEKELKTEYIVADNVIETEDQSFDIKYIETDHEVEGKIGNFVQCEHVSYRLITGSVGAYTFTGTPSQILADILTGTDFGVGTVEFVDIITFTVTEDSTKLKLIQRLAAYLGAEIDFSNKGFDVDLKNTIGQDNGFEIRLGKNLRQIKKVIDKRGQLKTYYAIFVQELKDSDLYKKNGFDVLEVLEIGDTIKVKDPAIGVDITNSVLTKTWNPIKSLVTFIELTNNLELLSDELVGIEANSVNKNDIIYGVTIDPSNGLVIERTDLLAKSVFNADEFAMKVGDGLGGYTDAVYFDPIDEEYKFVGNIEATGTITGAEIIGSSINNGSGTFQVDVAGNVTAASLTMTGGSITSANINISEDIFVGNDIFVGLAASSANKGVRFTGANVGLTTDASENMELRSNADLDLIGDEVTIFALGSGNDVKLTTAAGGLSMGTGGRIPTPGIGDMEIDLDSDFELQADNFVDLISRFSDVLIGANIGDVILSAGGNAYYGIPSANTEIATIGDLSPYITTSQADANYVDNGSGQDLKIQIIGGALEVFLSGVYQFTLTP